MSVPRVYLPAWPGAAGAATLPSDEAHHLTHVLRLGPGADITVFDGAGHEWRARVTSVSRRAVGVEVGEPVAAVREPPVSVTLGIGLLKGDQMDAVVRDATALGVVAIVPVMTAHVAVPLRARGEAARIRWQRVAVAAARQARRAVVPAVSAAVSFHDALDSTADARCYICVEPARAQRDQQAPEFGTPAHALVLVGPEGGWSDAELNLAAQRGAAPLSLGPRTLRAELAPAVALSALWTRWGW